MNYNNIQVIAFDADDTLWDNEPFFRNAEHRLCEMLAPYGTEEELSDRIFGVEMANMPDYGYGAIAFTMSLIESAIKISDGKITAKEIGEIIEMGRQLLRLDAKPLDGVAETLRTLKESGKYRLVVFTKGELLTQENKLKRSGLRSFFEKVFIVSDKKEGYGTFSYSSGASYEGEFKNNLMNGWGTYTWVSGRVYEGYFKNGTIVRTEE